MKWSEFFSSLPLIGWVSLILIIIVLGGFLYGVYRIFMEKDIKIRNFEASSEDIKKEQYKAEGKVLLVNQTNNARNLIRKIWIDIYRNGIKLYGITDSTELFILEDIAHLIEGKINNEVKNDLTRNHIVEKTDEDLDKYSSAKAHGYYCAVLSMLYQYNIQLPKYDLPKIMDLSPAEDYRKLFSEIYYSARKIAGGGNK